MYIRIYPICKKEQYMKGAQTELSQDKSTTDEGFMRYSNFLYSVR